MKTRTRKDDRGWIGSRRWILASVWLFASGSSFQFVLQAAVADSFLWSSPPSNVLANVPFPVTIQAIDALGETDGDYNDPVMVSGLASTPSPRLLISEVIARPGLDSSVELCNVSDALVDAGGWKLIFYDTSTWPNPKTTFVFPLGTTTLPRSVFRVFSGGAAPGAYPIFRLGSPLLWSNFTSENLIAVLLTDPADHPVDFFCAGSGYPILISSPILISKDLWQGLPLPFNFSSSRSYQRFGGLDHNNIADWTIASSTPGSINLGLRLPFVAPWRHLNVTPALARFTNGFWQGTLTLSDSVNMAWLHADDGAGVAGDSPMFDVLSGPPLALECPNHGDEATAGLLGEGRVFIPQILTDDLTVSLVTDLVGEIEIPAAVIIPSGQTNAFFSVTNLDDAVKDGDRTVTVTASATGFANASWIIINVDDETAVMNLTLPSEVSEGNGLLVAAGRIALDVPAGIDYPISLESSDTNEVQVPPLVYIPSGQTTATFHIQVLNDAYVDGPQIVTVQARTSGIAMADALVTVQDNENPTLRLQLYSPVEEGRGVVSNAVKITLGGLAKSNVVVNLISQNPGRIQLPSTMVVPANQNSALTHFTVLDDLLTNGLEHVNGTASAPGFSESTSSTAVRDNDLHHFFIAPIPNAQKSGQPISVTVYAHTIDGYVPSTYGELAFLSVIGQTGTLSATPQSIRFINGSWSGNVFVTGDTYQASITIDDGQGHSGESNPFFLANHDGYGAPISDVVYDKDRDLILVGIKSTATSGANTITGIDPKTGTILWRIPFDTEPGLMALADDSISLYVGQSTTGGVARINLETRMVTQRFPLGAGELAVEDMEVVPGQPQSIVVSRKSIKNDFNQGVAVFDNGVIRPDIAGVNFFCCGYSVGNFDTSGAFYSGYPSALRKLALSSSGIVQMREARGSVYGGDVIYSEGSLFSTFGHVFEPDSLALTASFPVSGLVVPALKRGMVYYLSSSSSGATIHAFDVTNQIRLATIQLPTFISSAKRFVPLGNDGFAALSSDGQLFVVNNPMADWQTSSGMDLSWSPNPMAAVMGEEFTYSLIVSNIHDEALQEVTLTERFGWTVELIGAQAAQGTCVWQSNTLVCALGDVPPSQELTIEIRMRSSLAGLLAHSATATGRHNETTWATDSKTFFTSVNPVQPDMPVTVLNLANRNVALDPINGNRYPPPDLVYDPLTDRIVVGHQRFEAAFAGGLAILDPNSGHFDRVDELNDQPAKLAMAPEGGYLYASLESLWKVQAYDTEANTVGAAFAINQNSLVQDMEVQPGHPEVVAVSTYFWDHPNLPSYVGATTLYDAGVPRMNQVRSPYIEFSEDGLYLYGSEVLKFYRDRISQAGLTREASLDIAGLAFYFLPDMKIANGLAHYGHGLVLDPNQLVYTNRFRAEGLPSIVCPDAQRRQVFFLEYFNTNWVIEAFDMDTASLAATLVIPNSGGFSPLNLVRWGNDGLAFSTREGKIVLARIGQMSHIPKLEVTQSVSPIPATIGSNLFISLTVSNSGPGVAHGVVLSDFLPRGSTLISANASQGPGQEMDGTVIFNLGTLTANQTETANLVVIPGLGGFNTNRCQATALTFDSSSGANTGSVEFWVNLGGSTDLVTELNLVTSDLAFDAAKRKLYASIPGSFAGLTNSVLGLDLESGSPDNPIPIGEPPGQMALSDNGQYLYVARTSTGGVSRVDLTVTNVDLTFGLADPDPPRYTTVGDMEVMPGYPETLAVSVLRGNGNIGVTIYDAGMPRSIVGPPSEFGGGHPIAFDGSSLIYQTRPFGFRRLSVQTTGIQFIDETSGLVPGYGVSFEFENGLVFFNSGRVTDPVNKINLWEYPVTGLVAPDTAHDRVYFLTQAGDPFSGPLLTLRSFDAGNRQELWSLPLPPHSGNYRRLLKLGMEGLGVATDAGKVFLIRSASIPERSADLSIEQTISPNPVSVDGTVTVNVTIRNHGLWSASNAQVRDELPAGLEFVSGTAPAGVCDVTNNTVTCSWNSLSNGAVATAVLVLKPTVLGLITNTIELHHDHPDFVLTNNVATASIETLPMPELVIENTAVPEGSTQSPILFQARLSSASTLPISVNYTTADGTAIAGLDYGGSTGILSIPPNTAAATLTLFPGALGNTSVGSNRFFFLQLHDPTNAILRESQAMAFILEDDFHSISIQDANILEGDEGRTEMVFNVSLSSAHTNPVLVDYVTQDGSASEASDYVPRAGRLLIPAGATNQNLHIPVWGDNCHEPDENLFLQLSAPVEAVLFRNEASGIILNDDEAFPLRILLLTFEQGTWQIQFHSVCDQIYRLLRSNTLEPGSWEIVAEAIAGTGNTITVIDPDSSQKNQAFYRLEAMFPGSIQ